MTSPYSRSRPRTLAAAAAVAASLGLLGCLDESDPELGDNLGDSAPDLTWEELRATVYQEPWPNGAFIVDGDVPIRNEEALRDFYEAWRRQSSTRALTVMSINGVDAIWPNLQRHVLTYCVSNSFGSRKAQVVAQMQKSTASWSDLVAVGYRYLPDQDASCTASNNNVVFNVRPVITDDYLARAFFPNEARPDRELLIDEDAFGPLGGGVDFDGVLRHELGHTLGFRHEHIHIACTAEDTDDSRQVTSYDVDSVMHYPQCRPSGGGGLRQSKLDYQGAITLYGLAGTLIDHALN